MLSTSVFWGKKAAANKALVWKELKNQKEVNFTLKVQYKKGGERDVEHVYSPDAYSN